MYRTAPRASAGRGLRTTRSGDLRRVTLTAGGGQQAAGPPARPRPRTSDGSDRAIEPRPRRGGTPGSVMAAQARPSWPRSAPARGRSRTSPASPAASGTPPHPSHRRPGRQARHRRRTTRGARAPPRSAAIASPTPACGSGSPSWHRTSPRSIECAPTSPWNVSAPAGPAGAVSPPNPSSANFWPASYPPSTCPPPRSSAATGLAATTSRSTSSARTANRSPPNPVPGIDRWARDLPVRPARPHRTATPPRRHRDRVTADPVPLPAVPRSGTTTKVLDAAFGPADLMEP